MTDTVKLTDKQGKEVSIPAEFVFGEAGDEAPIPFAITGEVFYACSAIPADDYGHLAALAAQMPKTKEGEQRDSEDAERAIRLLLEMVELFLMPESAERLADRLKSKERPVGIPQLMQVIGKFLNDVYVKGEDEDGGRPTPPTSG